ncbi:hypothetical protein ACQR0Z_21220 [Bradyrhizobium sp. HKCCYLS3077]|uniref:hypothetical protein n=1 Tax=Bradyrhizobium sp. HKCCYLS3077 TaxID=3420761 RepID=UPI003EB6F466
MMLAASRKRLGAALLLVTCIGPSSSLAQTDTPTSVTTITVDAASIVSDSGRDDLATLKTIFRGANAPQDGTIAPMRGIIADIGLKRLRLLQADALCDLDSEGRFGERTLDASGQFGAVVAGGCGPLDTQIDWALSNGLSLHIAAASFMPVSFVPGGPAETWSAAELDRYRSYVDQLVRHVVQRAFDPATANGGAQAIVFECSNELDIADPEPVNFHAVTPPDPARFALLPLGPWARFLWWMDPATYKLQEWPVVDDQAYPYSTDPRRLARGLLPIQKIFADRIEAIRGEASFGSDYPGRILDMAGPAFSSVSFDRYPPSGLPTLEERFLEQTLDPAASLDPATGRPRFQAALDRFSFHFYGDFQHGWNPQAPSSTTLAYLVQTIRAKLAQLNRPDMPLFVSEWGPSVDTNSDVNYSHKGAAWTAAFLKEAVRLGISDGSYLMLHDGIGYDPGMIGMPSLMHKIISDGVATYQPKPVANVMRMFAMMSGQRRTAALSTPSALDAFAASDGSSAGIVVFNYNSAYSDDPQSFSVAFENLPFDGPATVRRFVVDANTSNLAAYLLQPTRPDPTLQTVEEFQADVRDGQMVLPARSLGLGVTFWQVIAIK